MDGFVFLDRELLQDVQVFVKRQPHAAHEVGVDKENGNDKQKDHHPDRSGNDKDKIPVPHIGASCDDPIGPAVQGLNRGQLPVGLVLLHPVDDLVNDRILKI